MSLTITHTHAAGTLIDGTSRGDGSAEVLKTVVNPYTGRAGAWRWSRNLGSWYVARSRDTRANTALIDATKAALEAAGFTVHVEIDDACRPAAEVEADAVARQEDRVAALGAKAEHSAGAAYAAEDRARELADRMPLGQPILVGHHSEARMRKAYANIENASRASVAAYEEAKTAEARAAAASTTTAFRYSPGVIRRRIERLEADLRRCERARDGHTRTLFTDCRGVKQVETHGAAEGAHRERVLADIARLEDQIAFWNGELAKAADAGAQVWDAATVEVGDRIRYWGGWDTVAKVNAKSVRLASRTGRLPFDQIKAVSTGDGRAVRIIDGARTIVDDASAGE
jgi:hypothetical protein